MNLFQFHGLGRLALGTSIVLLISFAQAVVIDDFSSGTPQHASSASGGYGSSWVSAPTALGGSRGIQALGHSNTLFNEIDVTPGLFTARYNDSGFRAIVNYLLDSSFNLNPATDMDLSWATSWTFHFNYLTARTRMVLVIEDYDSAHSPSNAYGSYVEPSATPFSVTLTSDHLIRNEIDARRVDWVHLEIFTIGNDPVELQLTSLTAVPEPSTVAVLGISLLVLARRRRSYR